jgi:hypothetical protein
MYSHSNQGMLLSGMNGLTGSHSNRDLLSNMLKHLLMLLRGYMSRVSKQSELLLLCCRHSIQKRLVSEMTGLTGSHSILGRHPNMPMHLLMLGQDCKFRVDKQFVTRRL